MDQLVLLIAISGVVCNVLFLLMLYKYYNCKKQLGDAKIAEKTLMLETDFLTGAPNRKSLSDTIDHYISIHIPFAILFIDLDKFKIINDTFGHDVGDSLLIEVVNRIKQLIRTEDILFRLSGDEFVCLVKTDDKQHLSNVALRIIYEINREFNINDFNIRITGSVGISIYPKDAYNAFYLLKCADLAMYKAKESGNMHCYYSHELSEHSLRSAQLSNDIKFAIEKQELMVYYQPQINLFTNQIIGCEALLRWDHPILGFVSPGKFIPIAEDTDEIISIGNWVLGESCVAINTWKKNIGLEYIRVGVNISAKQVLQGDLYDHIVNILCVTNVEPNFLDLELTESVLIRNEDAIAAVLNKVNKLGITLSIDDFGTGYCNFDYIRKFPVNRIKIDRVFVKDICSNDRNQSIVKAIVTLARSLDVVVLAEGIETMNQVNMLKELGVQEGQGYLFSYPLPRTEFEFFYKSFTAKEEN